MRLTVLAMIAAATAGSAVAQDMCTVAAGAVPPCMVGTWVGENDMAARLDQMFAGLPEDVQARARESSGQALFIRIEADGWFVTSSLAAGADVAFMSDAGWAEDMEVSLSTTGGTGFFTASGRDDLAFCSQTGGFGTVSIGGDMAPVVPDAAMPPMPMRQECAGDSLQMFVDLPPPMGTVTYSLNRVPAADIPPELEMMLPSR